MRETEFFAQSSFIFFIRIAFEKKKEKENQADDFSPHLPSRCCSHGLHSHRQAL